MAGATARTRGAARPRATAITTTTILTRSTVTIARTSIALITIATAARVVLRSFNKAAAEGTAGIPLTMALAIAAIPEVMVVGMGILTRATVTLDVSLHDTRLSLHDVQRTVYVLCMIVALYVISCIILYITFCLYVCLSNMIRSGYYPLSTSGLYGTEISLAVYRIVSLKSQDYLRDKLITRSRNVVFCHELVEDAAFETPSRCSALSVRLQAP